MSWALVAAALGSTAALIHGCKTHCRTAEDCGSPGEFCDFTTGHCQQGCTRDADCGGSARCNVAVGNCLPGAGTIGFSDAGPQPDAGPVDTLQPPVFSPGDSGPLDSGPLDGGPIDAAFDAGAG